MSTQTIQLNGKSYVIVPKDEYETMQTLSRLPPLPDPDKPGNFPAAEYARVNLARDIILTRTRLGISQAELARMAGMRPETLNRIETGKVTPTVASIDRIDRALSKAKK
ncbi:MAG TPA: helix-turn-helix transcriptional regulator [Planctomicrobium sp.]|nr:helix-turn-helix transcriptional regulator [Planctomicrobium sp.]